MRNAECGFFLPRMNRMHTDDIPNCPVWSGRDPTALMQVYLNTRTIRLRASTKTPAQPANIVSEASKHRERSEQIS